MAMTLIWRHCNQVPGCHSVWYSVGYRYNAAKIYHDVEYSDDVTQVKHRLGLIQLKYKIHPISHPYRRVMGVFIANVLENIRVITAPHCMRTTAFGTRISMKNVIHAIVIFSFSLLYAILCRIGKRSRALTMLVCILTHYSLMTPYSSIDLALLLSNQISLIRGSRIK